MSEYIREVTERWERAQQTAEQKVRSGEVDLTVIPAGWYCYTGHDIKTDPTTGEVYYDTTPCPYWSIHPEQGEQRCGYCSLLEIGDWQHQGVGLLWDQVKECNYNPHHPEEDLIYLQVGEPHECMPPPLAQDGEALAEGPQSSEA